MVSQMPARKLFYFGVLYDDNGTKRLSASAQSANNMEFTSVILFIFFTGETKECTVARPNISTILTSAHGFVMGPFL